MNKQWGDVEEEKKRAQEEAIREQEERDRARAEWRRDLATALHFPILCTDLRCKRARRCAGNVEACFPFFWPHVPEDTKNEIRQTMKLLKEGVPAHEAVRQAQAYVEQRKRIDEAMALRAAAEAAAARGEAALEAKPTPITVTRTHPPARGHGPRIRGL